MKLTMKKFSIPDFPHKLINYFLKGVHFRSPLFLIKGPNF